MAQSFRFLNLVKIGQKLSWAGQKCSAMILLLKYKKCRGPGTFPTCPNSYGMIVISVPQWSFWIIKSSIELSWHRWGLDSSVELCVGNHFYPEGFHCLFSFLINVELSRSGHCSIPWLFISLGTWESLGLFIMYKTFTYSKQIFNVVKQKLSCQLSEMVFCF